VRAHLKLAGADSLDGILEIVWDDDEPDAVADVRGTLGGARVAARIPAP
jgi:hypothetical protein